MTALDLLNLDVLLARSVLLRADYMSVQRRIRDAITRERETGDVEDGASEYDFDELVAAMSRSLSADARYLCTLSLIVRRIIEQARAAA
ncbi:hypothetical protein M2165_004909 [Variovorax sp. TBS-050B]|jgi:hypothetical protein|uniref:hypothetical protein n=1 Tax=Variovorax sp. TBS-050B TaxID=2940551 RepID=UPI002475F050|nr:hypothetical protein [Variovorax sp. TBS-050B]MDH6595020.1 hypothetical protein [Variovorax sp. TBS-050B]